MKTHFNSKIIVTTMIVTMIVISINSCKKEAKEVLGCTDSKSLSYNSAATKDDGSCKYPFSVTQSNINNSTTTVVLNGTGTTYGSASTPHDGNMANMDLNSTLRSVYTNLSTKSGTISVGTIFTKRVYKNNNGSPDSLRATFTMVKREAGYWTEGGDWEYIMTPYSAMVNYSSMPNGMLPATADNMMRGKIMMCAGCHNNSQTKGDWIFANN